MWWRCFFVLFENITFLSNFFSLLAMSKSSRVRFRLFVTLNTDTIAFSHLCFLVIVVLWILVLFLITVMSLSLFFFLCSLWVVLLMYWRCLHLWPVLFLLLFLTHIASLSCLRCKAWYIMSFFVLLSSCWSFSLVLFKNGPEYLTWRIVKSFIRLLRFQHFF